MKTHRILSQEALVYCKRIFKDIPEHDPEVYDMNTILILCTQRTLSFGCKVYIIRTCADVLLVSCLLNSPALCVRNSSQSRITEASGTGGQQKKRLLKNALRNRNTEFPSGEF
jgi:hypothetical protein